MGLELYLKRVTVKGKMKMKKCTVAEKLIKDGWFSSEDALIPWIMAGKILADDRLIYSPAEKISPDARIRIREYYKARYVSKGGLKLEHALAVFGIVVRNKNRVGLRGIYPEVLPTVCSRTARN